MTTASALSFDDAISTVMDRWHGKPITVLGLRGRDGRIDSVTWGILSGTHLLNDETGDVVFTLTAPGGGSIGGPTLYRGAFLEAEDVDGELVIREQDRAVTFSPA